MRVGYIYALPNTCLSVVILYFYPTLEDMASPDGYVRQLLTSINGLLL